jgi:ABC-type antimicrobial peptide transport system permease subunit
MSQETDKEIKKQGLIRGVFLGLIISAISIIYFYFMVTIAKSAVVITFGSMVFSYLLPLTVAALFSLNLRAKIGGLWTMRQAGTGIFIMFFVSYLMAFIIKDQLFAKVIEPNMVQKTETAMGNALNKLKDETTKPEEKKEADAKIVEMKKAFDAERTVTIGQQIQSLGISIILLFVLSIIFAAFFKKVPAGSASR